MRKVNERYLRKNGFDEVTKKFPTPTESLKEGEATENQDLARFVIREMGSFFPSLAEMREEVQVSEGPQAQAETLATLTERIKRSNRENQEDVAKLSRYYVQGLYDDAMDRYCQTDDIKYHDFEDFTSASSAARNTSGTGPANDEWAQHYARIENLFKQYDKIVVSEHNDLVARMQYGHLREVLPLYLRRREVERKEEMTRLIQAAAKEDPHAHGQTHTQAHFPQSIEEYRMMARSGRKYTQLLIARFLIASEPTQGLLRTRCHWTRSQTQPLIDEYKNDEAFRSEIEGIVKVQEWRDPRNRRTGELAGSGIREG